MNSLDDEIHQDVQAIQTALTEESFSESSQDYEDEEETGSSSPSSLHIRQALRINWALSAKYRKLKEVMQYRLHEISKEKKRIELKIKLLRKIKGEMSWPNYSKAMLPYFKDSDRFPAPLNDDALIKLQKGEIMFIYGKSACPWSLNDQRSMLLAIRLEAAEKYLQQGPSTSKQRSYRDFTDEDFNRIIGAVGTREFDWMKISALTLRSRHTPDECRNFWNVWLHPHINRNNFTDSEDTLIYDIAHEQKFQNWELLAEKLGGGRTSYQYFYRFGTVVRRKHRKDMMWTNVDKELLTKIVEAVSIGNYVPWATVAFYFCNRTKTQVYGEWRYSIMPKVRKGPFKRHEDELLLEGVAMYGHDFSRISSDFLPNRSSVSLYRRLKLLMLRADSKNKWTFGEDMRLLKLFSQLGKNWSTISRIMDRETKYVRQRYYFLLRKLAIGKTLIDIRTEPNKIDDLVDDNLEEIFILTNTSLENELDIDTRLNRYFARINPPIWEIDDEKELNCQKATKEQAKQLYILFRYLNVTFNIPENLDSYDLTPRDRQLLNAYKHCVNGSVESSTNDYIEQIRLKMFGSDEDVDAPYYIPPPPFGLYFEASLRKNPVKRNKNVISDTQIELDYEFTGFYHIESKLTIEERYIFQKLSAMVSTQDKEISIPQSLKTKSIPEETYEEPEEIPIDENITISWGKCIKDPVDRNAEQANFLHPSYSTLLGYSILRYMREVNDNIDWSEGERKMSQIPISRAGKKAYQLFKARFFTTFKYAIGMIIAGEAKKISHKEIIDLTNDSDSDSDSP
uniref:Myb-like domain-containing protein n=1 Tax=Bracon brevicornis TaxID=1563983 RepID=A0A6V7L153_9HYME